AEIGTSFANSAVAHPKFCAALIGTLIKGMGVDHVMWGTDSVWTGAPQWQIEGLRRLEIPEDMQKKYGFAPLGPADGPVKRGIFASNGFQIFGYNRHAELITADRFAAIKEDYLRGGADPSNLRYGYVRKA